MTTLGIGIVGMALDIGTAGAGGSIVKAGLKAGVKPRWLGYVLKRIARICNPCPQSEKKNRNYNKSSMLFLYLSINLYVNVNKI
jgi:hypothetical protein